MNDMSKATQETTVIEGLAIGFLALGRNRITSSKISIESAATFAWPRWQWAAQFPAVKVSLQRNVIWQCINKSEGRRGHTAAWATDDQFEPYIKHDWTFEECARILASGDEIPLRGWTELAALFIEWLDRYPEKEASA